jgi:hypothetical protein
MKIEVYSGANAVALEAARAITKGSRSSRCSGQVCNGGEWWKNTVDHASGSRKARRVVEQRAGHPPATFKVP